MSIYKDEKPQYFRECLESLEKQTLKADEWVIVEDGPLTTELYDILNEYQNKYPMIIKRVKSTKNEGLGKSLNKGLKKCKNEIVARMDTDDISKDTRLEEQFEEFHKNPDLDICGTQIDEFEDNPNEIKATRKVPCNHDDIIAYQKKRDAFNHMSVMYRKTSVIRAGSYMHCPLMEDTYLWVRMIQNGAKCKNINKSLVLARIGEGMYERRGGMSYFLKYKKAKKIILDTGFITRKDYYETLIIQFIVAVIPSKIRGTIYKKILHRK